MVQIRAQTELNIRPLKELSTEKPTIYRPYGIPIVSDAVGMILAHGGSGKTMLAILMAYHFVMENPQKKAFLWLTEDPEGLLRDRGQALTGWMKANGVDLSRDVHVSTAPPVKMTKTKGDDTYLTEDFEDVKKQLIGYDFIVIDPLVSFTGGKERDNDSARVFMNGFNQWAKADGKAILFLHHLAKGEEGVITARGAGDFTAAARYLYHIKYDQDTKDHRLGLVKDNYGLQRFWEPVYSYKSIKIIPPHEFFTVDVKEVHEDTSDKVYFSYSTETAEGYKSARINFNDFTKVLRSNHNYSAAQYRDEYRNAANAMQGQNILIFDVDGGWPIKDAGIYFRDYKSIIATTKSHGKEKNGVICDRFRVVVKTKTPITLSAEDYKKMYKEICYDIPNIDSSCQDISRFYYGNPEANCAITGGHILFDWEQYYKRALKREEYENKEYAQYKKQYDNGGTIEGKRKGRETFARENLINGRRNESLYKLVKFMERDGLQPGEIVAETIGYAQRCGIDKEELRKTVLRDYRNFI